MREPYIELGIGIIGQAIRDWRRESESHNFKLKTENMKNIERFLKGELANLICQQIDLEPKVLLKNLKKENRQKWLEYEKAEMERLREDDQGKRIDSCQADEQKQTVRQDRVAEETGAVRVCG